jgi:hypothetical protein
MAVQLTLFVEYDVCVRPSYIFIVSLSSWDPIIHSTSLVYGLDIVYGLKMAQ